MANKEYTQAELAAINQAKFVKANYKMDVSNKLSYDNIRWLNPKGDLIGLGFRGKGKEKIYLEVCPACGRENYKLNVQSGVCTFCPFDANGEINV